MNQDPLHHFQNAVRESKAVAHSNLPSGPLNVANSGIALGHVGPAGFIGFTPIGARSFARLTAILHSTSDRYARAASLDQFRSAVMKIVLHSFAPGSHVGGADLTLLHQRISEWFDNERSPLTMYVPCAIVPEIAPGFSVGPVTFFHASQLAERKLSDPLNSLPALERLLQERGGRWIAEVTVNAEQKRCEELGGLAVDLALCSLSLVLPDGRVMSRLTGRVPHYWYGSWSTRPGQATLMQSVTNNESGAEMSPEFFALAVKDSSNFLEACGWRIASFLDTQMPMHPVERAWCDAAYWYYEAMQEPLDTISIAKMESALENLCSAENLSKSGSRIRALLRGFLGLSAKTPVFKGSSVTAEEFVEELVTGRSRVLHGTASTLSGRIQLSRREVAGVAKVLLQQTCVFMDEFMAANGNADPQKYAAWTGGADDRRTFHPAGRVPLSDKHGQQRRSGLSVALAAKARAWTASITGAERRRPAARHDGNVFRSHHESPPPRRRPAAPGCSGSRCCS